MGDFATSEAIKLIFDEIKDINNRIDNAQSRIIRLETAFEGLAKLPDTIHNLEKTLVLIEARLGHIAEKIDDIKQDNNEQNEAIRANENRGRFDLINWLTENWIIAILSGVFALAWSMLIEYIKTGG